MFGFSIVLAALAFTGAPATPVRCNPELPTGLQGVTRWVDASQPAALIELGQTACAGVLLLGASPSELQKIAALNPGLNVALDEGIGAQVVLMEAEHTTHPYGGLDETNDLCAANAALPGFLSRYLNGEALASALRWAAIYTAAEPAAIYHTHPC